MPRPAHFPKKDEPGQRVGRPCSRDAGSRPSCQEFGHGQNGLAVLLTGQDAVRFLEAAKSSPDTLFSAESRQCTILKLPRAADRRHQGQSRFRHGRQAERSDAIRPSSASRSTGPCASVGAAAARSRRPPERDVAHGPLERPEGRQVFGSTSCDEAGAVAEAADRHRKRPDEARPAGARSARPGARPARGRGLGRRGRRRRAAAP